MDHSNPLQGLYKDYNIESSTNAKKDDFKFFIKTVFDSEDIEFVVEPVNISELTKSNVDYQIDSFVLFNTAKEANDHSNYLSYLNSIVVAAKRVNEADSNYKPDFTNEDERKYIIRYDGRNGTLSYDYTYAMMDSAIDYNIVFRTQQITENFINNFSGTLKTIMLYRLNKLRNDRVV